MKKKRGGEKGKQMMMRMLCLGCERERERETQRERERESECEFVAWFCYSSWILWTWRVVVSDDDWKEMMKKRRGEKMVRGGKKGRKLWVWELCVEDSLSGIRDSFAWTPRLLWTRILSSLSLSLLDTLTFTTSEKGRNFFQFFQHYNVVGFQLLPKRERERERDENFLSEKEKERKKYRNVYIFFLSVIQWWKFTLSILLTSSSLLYFSLHLLLGYFKKLHVSVQLTIFPLFPLFSSILMREHFSQR